MKALIRPFIYIVSALMALSFASCNDFLDKEPEGKVPEEKVDYTNISNMYQPVSGVYAKIRTSGLHWVIWEITTIRDQDVFSGQWNGSDYYNLSEYKYNDSFWGINELWMQYYNIIKTANAAIESLDLYAENITNDNAVNKYALEDLQYGIDNMPRIRPNQNEHKGAVTAFSAEMLAAKIHLNMGNYAKVEELTDDIIEHGNFSLYPDFYQLFKIPGKLCDESIFESQMTDFGNGSGDLIDP